MKLLAPVALVLLAFGMPAEASRSWQQFDSLTSIISKNRLLLDVVRVDRGRGDRIVTVGAFGHILVSDDEGASWRQVKVPVSKTLSAVYFPSVNIGYAVGQDNIILKTEDSGENWRLVNIDPDIETPENRRKSFSDEPDTCSGAQQKDNCLIPLLAVYFRDDRNGLAVGAFGQALSTNDGGETWRWRPLPRAKVKDEFEDPKNPNDDFIEEQAHLNGITQTPNGNIYVAAEYGTVYRSTNGGKNFTPLRTGYNGSFWGALALGNSVLAYGMRGNIWRSDNNGSTWRQLDTGKAQQSFQDGARFVRGLNNGTVVLTGLNGVIATSRDQGRSFKACTRPERKGYAALLESKGGTGNILLFGETGVSKIELANPCKKIAVGK